jgi:hypothetical protein
MSDTEFIYAIEAPSYVAVVSTPGYLPESEPVEFDTAAEAWAYLAEERKRAEDENPDWSDHDCPFPQDCDYSDTYAELLGMGDEVGSVSGETPGYEGDHDLGLAYSVEVAETD